AAAAVARALDGDGWRPRAGASRLLAGQRQTAGTGVRGLYVSGAAGLPDRPDPTGPRLLPPGAGGVRSTLSEGATGTGPRASNPGLLPQHVRDRREPGW